jgi:hypothetical protein
LFHRFLAQFGRLYFDELHRLVVFFWLNDGANILSGHYAAWNECRNTAAARLAVHLIGRIRLVGIKFSRVNITISYLDI